MSVEALNPVPTLAEQRGRGGEGWWGAEGGVLLPVEPKVKGCHRPANGDEELTLNLTLPVGWGWWVWMCALSAWSLPSAQETEALCCSLDSLSRPFSLFSPPLALPRFPASFPPPSVSDLGTGSGERQVRSGRGISAGRQGGREGEKGRKSTQVWLTGLSSGWDQALYLEVGGAEETQSQSGSAEQEELPGDFHTARRH